MDNQPIQMQPTPMPSSSTPLALPDPRYAQVGQIIRLNHGWVLDIFGQSIACQDANALAQALFEVATHAEGWTIQPATQDTAQPVESVEQLDEPRWDFNTDESGPTYVERQPDLSPEQIRANELYNARILCSARIDNRIDRAEFSTRLEQFCPTLSADELSEVWNEVEAEMYQTGQPVKRLRVVKENE